jgi:hypothetical protein
MLCHGINKSIQRLFTEGKRRMKHFVLLPLLFLSLLTVAQTTINYRFDASLENGKVHMNIVIRAGSICQGIFIARSTDSLQFTEIGDIPGICGNSSSDMPYTFTDLAPVPNATNYYRLRFGENGYSHVLPVLYIQLEDNYKIVPNPAHGQTTIYFDNDDNTAYDFRLTDIKGSVVMEQAGIKENQFQLNVGTLTPGTYSFSLRNKDAREISGKLVVR